MPGAKREQVLTLEPAGELVFTGDFTQRMCRTTLTLGNPTETIIAYKVKTTAPRRYCVRPNSGRIEPGQSATVNIMLQPSQNNDDLQKHKFMVQSIECPAGGESDIAVDDMFRNTPSGEVMSKKLYCQFNNQVQDPASAGAPESASAEPVEPITAEEPSTEQNTVENLYANTSPVKKIERPEISAVPEEPKIINPEPEMPAPVVQRAAPVMSAPAEPEGARAPPRPAPEQSVLRTTAPPPKPTVQTTSRGDMSSTEKMGLLKQIKDQEGVIAALNAKIKNDMSQGAMQPVEDPSTVRKVMFIIGICSLIMGYFVGTWFCKSC